MKIYRTRQGQSIFDIAIQLYGNEEFANEILKNNSNLDINTTIPSGTNISYNEENAILPQYFIDKKIDVTTDQKGTLNIGGGFNVGFNNGFN